MKLHSQLILITLIITIHNNTIPFASCISILIVDQFRFEPVPGGVTPSTNSDHDTTLTLPLSYNTSYTRAIVSSGVKL